MKTIVLFGQGHLGGYLLKQLKGFHIISTKTQVDEPSQDTIKYLVGQPIPSEIPTAPIAVIWTVPPRQGYEDSLKFANQFFKKTVPWFFISSTSVYKSGDVNESSVLNGETANAKLLIELETQLKKMERITTILRPGGLVDEYRHPARFLSQKDVIENGLDPVNLVHTEDVARFINLVIEKPKLQGDIYNLVSDVHDSKKEYYDPFLKKYFNKEIVFNLDTNKNKTVSNQKSKSAGFTYKNIRYPQLKLLFT